MGSGVVRPPNPTHICDFAAPNVQPRKRGSLPRAVHGFYLGGFHHPPPPNSDYSLIGSQPGCGCPGFSALLFFFSLCLGVLGLRAPSVGPSSPPPAHPSCYRAAHWEGEGVVPGYSRTPFLFTPYSVRFTSPSFSLISNWRYKSSHY